MASFRSTLEELHQADLLIHVVDAGSAQAREELEVTEDILKELGVEEKPRIVVLNKADRLTTPAARNQARLVAPGAISISAIQNDDVVRLRDHILDYFRKKLQLWEVLIPYSESKLESQLYAHGSVETVRHLEKGTFYRVRMDEGWARKLELARYGL